MVLQCSVRQSAGCTCSGVIRYELQSDVQVAATCAGPRSAEERPCCTPGLAAANAGPGAT